MEQFNDENVKKSQMGISSVGAKEAEEMKTTPAFAYHEDEIQFLTIVRKVKLGDPVDSKTPDKPLDVSVWPTWKMMAPLKCISDLKITA